MRTAAKRSTALDHARGMRKSPTDAKHRLWQILRAKRLAGWKFRRQQPIGIYIVDFYCSSARLVIETDGGQHAESRQDAIRDRWLKAQSLQILRFWNNEIFVNEEGVLTSILAALEAGDPASSRIARTPLPHPSPARGKRH